MIERKNTFPTLVQSFIHEDLWSLHVCALCRMGLRCQGRAGPRTQCWLCTAGVLETRMRVISRQDAGEKCWNVSKRAWEVRKYSEQAKTNVLGNFSIKETKKWKSSLKRR